MMTIYSAALLVLIASASAYTSPNPVELGSADDYVILTKTGVTTTGVTHVTGDMASSPIGETAMTGFALVRSIDNEFSTSGLVTGKVTSATHHEPTPTVLIAAISDMETAYTAAAGAVPDSHEFFDGDLTGQTLAPGVYKWTSPVSFSGQLVFDGTASDIWILQIAKNLVVASGAEVILAGGAKAENIFWQVAEAATFGSGSTVNGIFLVKTNMSFNAGSTLNGAALVQTAVTMISTTINKAVVKKCTKCVKICMKEAECAKKDKVCKKDCADECIADEKCLPKETKAPTEKKPKDKCKVCTKKCIKKDECTDDDEDCKKDCANKCITMKKCPPKKPKDKCKACTKKCIKEDECKDEDEDCKKGCADKCVKKCKPKKPNTLLE